VKNAHIFWNSRARAYDNLVRDYPHFSVLVDRLLRDLPGPQRLLDLGCGAGLLTTHARQQFPAAHISIADPAPDMLALARQNLGGDTPSHCVLAEEADRIPDEFDTVLASAALHLADESRFIPAVARILTGVFRFNLWWHCFEETAEWRIPSDGADILDEVLAENHHAPWVRPDVEPSRPRRRQDLHSLCEASGLLLSDIRVEPVSIPEHFFIRFRAMDGSFLADLGQRRRRDVIARACERADTVMPVPMVQVEMVQVA